MLWKEMPSSFSRPWKTDGQQQDVSLKVILNLVLDRFDVEVDLTEGGIYTIGEEMESFIRESDSKVNIFFVV